ncbi:MAG: enoyl-CoA hydratase/isomerase family protein [Beijerinckiaceae bacterium]|jgi:enoyl-CoA hydratase|nr:enoyl-CoA hydratase/isomerase family protein [Beijerinckiaceae bacterium]
MTSGHSDLLAEKRGALGLVTLNRPQALNALNDPMVDGLRAALDEWREDDTVRHVLIRGTGPKAFCAGGDIRLMHDLGKAGKQDVALDFWAREYRLNSVIQHYPKPYIALIDGIVMGGGVGVSLHGSHRLAGPNYLFAMPEVGIGFFPDVGASYALPRLKGAVGAWLAVTGARIRRADALELGLATHAVRPDCEEELLMHLMAGVPIEAALGRISEHEHEAPILGKLDAINRHFSFGSVGEILASLEAAGPEDAFAHETLAGMRAKSPMSMAIAIEQVKRGRDLDFNAAMVMEYRIVSRLVHDADFYEGVRALIIDKDNHPHWNPSRIEDVDPAKVAAHFMPLPRDLDLPGA